MTTYHGHCACGQTKWDVTLEKDQASHILWSVLTLPLTPTCY